MRGFVRRAARGLTACAILALAACGITAVGVGPGAGDDGTNDSGNASSSSSGSASSSGSIGVDGGDGGATCIADLEKDPANCGACGHDCQGGGCFESACLPTLFAADEPGVIGVAVVGTDVMWTRPNHGLVRAMPAAGGTPRTVTIANDGGPTNPWAITTNGANLFLTDRNAGQVSMYDLAGNAVWKSGPFVTPSGVATDSTAVYFAIQNNDGVQSIPIDGGNDASNRLGGLNYPAGVALTADRIFAASGSGIMSGPKDGGGGAIVISPTSRFTDAGPDLIHTGLAIDGATVFFTIESKGIVATVPTMGGAGRILARDQKAPWGIAVSPATIYWANNADGTLMKLAR